MNPESETARPPATANAPKISDAQILPAESTSVKSGLAEMHALTAEETANQEKVFCGLAALSLPDYDRAREKSAAILRIRVTTLDDEVERRRKSADVKNDQGAATNSKDPEPWPEVVDGALVLHEVAQTLERYSS